MDKVIIVFLEAQDNKRLCKLFWKYINYFMN